MRLRHFNTALHVSSCFTVRSAHIRLVCDCKDLAKSWEIVRIEHVALLTSSSAACDLLLDFVGKTDFAELQRAKTETNVQQRESQKQNHLDSQR